MRERPRLAGEVAQLADAQAGLLVDLAVHRLLGRFARVHEAGERAVQPGRKVRRAPEQDLAAALDGDDDHRRHARVVFAAAVRIGAAAHRRRPGDERRGRAALAAEAVRTVELEQFEGARGEAAGGGGQGVEQGLEVAEFVAGRRLAVALELDHRPRPAVGGAEVERAQRAKAGQPGGRRRRECAVGIHQQLMPAKHQRVRRPAPVEGDGASRHDPRHVQHASLSAGRRARRRTRPCARPAASASTGAAPAPAHRAWPRRATASAGRRACRGRGRRGRRGRRR